MTGSNSTTEASNRNIEPVIVYGHTKVVYTWPMLITGSLLMLLHLTGMPAEWAQWLFAFSLCFVLTTLAIDIKGSNFMIGLVIIVLVLIIMGLVQYIGLNIFLALWNSFETTGPYGGIVIWLVLLWLVDLADSWLYKRVKFSHGEIIQFQFLKNNIELRSEHCEASTPTDDVVEFLIWGGRIVIMDREKDVTIELRNVFKFMKKFQIIRPHLPSDRSDRNG